MVLITTAPTFGVRAAKLEANSNSRVFATSQPIIAAHQPQIGPRQAHAAAHGAEDAHFVLYQHDRRKGQHDGQQHAGTSTSIIPICTRKVVNRISSSSLGSTGAEAPMARRALTR